MAAAARGMAAVSGSGMTRCHVAPWSEPSLVAQIRPLSAPDTVASNVIMLGRTFMITLRLPDRNALKIAYRARSIL